MKYRMELIGSTVSRAVGIWPPEPEPVNAAPGLYATPGDGTATPVTPEMLAAAIDDVLGQYPGSTSASVAGMIIKRVLEGGR